MIIGNKIFDTDHETYIMGILNVTPDSFSDGGKHNTLEAALKQTEEMIKEGASIIDVGGESTRPGYQKISAEEEIERIMPVLEAIKSRFDTPISVDTYKSAVAKEAIKAGVDMINDIWGFKADDNMAKLCQEAEVAVCLMHNRSNKDYLDFRKDLLKDLQESLKIAKDHKIADDKIILDPGVGFAKDSKHNLLAINYLADLKKLGYPILLGTSRKSVIGNTLKVPLEERLEGTIVTTVLGIERGASFVRVHDVKENKRAIDMTRAILNT